MAAGIRKSIKASGILVFFVYVVMLIYLLFFSENYGRGIDGAVYDYNICPFREIRRYLTYWEVLGIRTVFLNLAGNVIGFMPFGVLLPVFYRDIRKAWKVAALSFEISAVVEVSQLVFQVGCFDVDDMILNTAGGLLGYAVFLTFCGWYRNLAGRIAVKDETEILQRRKPERMKEKSCKRENRKG